MSLPALLTKLNEQPEQVTFEEVMETISNNYHYQPTAFKNGALVNASGSNEGSCKIFAFAQINQLSVAQTLACFGRFYREDVLQNPQGNDHGNIRNFMEHGWDGIEFTQAPLSPLA